MWPAKMLSMSRREGRQLLGGVRHLQPLVRRVRGGGGSVQGRDWQECFLQRGGAPRLPRGQRRRQVCALAPQCPSPPEQTGCSVQHEGEDGGTPLDSDLDQGAGEEANSPAGGARGDGGDVVGGVHFHQHQDCDCKHFDI